MLAATCGLTAQTNYTIKGTAPAGITQVEVKDMQKLNTVLQTVSVKDGQFSATGTAEKDAFIGVGAAGEQKVLIFINDGKDVELNLNDMTLKGSPVNMKLNECDRQMGQIQMEGMQMAREYQEKISAASEQDEERLKEEFMGKIRVFSEKFENAVKKIVADNRDNLIPAYFLPHLAPALSYEDLKDALDAKYAYTSHPMLESAKKQLAALEKEMKIIGTKFTDLEEAAPDGTTHKLSEWVGKGNYVLVDFWASWCGPCRQEMPNVVAAYEKYHAKGFDIVGLSLDNNKAAWEKAIYDLKMPWHHLSDLKGWQSVAAQVYEVRSIPSSLLVGPDGTIVAKNLRGDALGQKLQQLYGF